MADAMRRSAKMHGEHVRAPATQACQRMDPQREHGRARHFVDPRAQSVLHWAYDSRPNYSHGSGTVPLEL